MNELTLFDYGQLDIESRIVVKQRTEEIKTLVRRSAQDIIDIGNKLIDVKARLGHGGFGGWLDAEFGWSDQTARRFMHVAEFSKINTGVDFMNIQAKALYLLAAPSTPEPARIEAIERAQAGEAITYTAAKTIVEQHRTPEPPPPAPVQRIYESAASEYEEIANDIEENGYEWSRSELIEFNDATEEEMREAERELVKEYRELAQEDRQMLPPPSPPAPAPTEATPIPAAISPTEDGDEYYTPPYIIEAARQVLGDIDLDPASSSLAQTVVKAKHYYTKEDDGLIKDWNGTVWHNPPYSRPAPFVAKLISEYEAGNVTAAILLVNTGTETQWGQSLLTRYPVCFVGAHGARRSRISFWRDDPESPDNRNRYSQMIFYLGEQVERFGSIFRQFGAILEVRC